jgi:hypothetical protein
MLCVREERGFIGNCDGRVEVEQRVPSLLYKSSIQLGLRVNCPAVLGTPSWDGYRYQK